MEHSSKAVKKVVAEMLIYQVTNFIVINYSAKVNKVMNVFF